MDFEPHSPGFQEAFSDLESGLGLTVGSFNFFVNKLGVQDLTDPRQLATSAPEATSVAAPSTADPSTASIPSSILQACSSATTMSTREMHELIEELQGELRRRLLKVLKIDECRGQRLVPLRDILSNLQT